MDDFLNAMDPNRNGFVQAMDPNRNGFTRAMDPNRNGVADHFDPQKNGMAINFSKESINQQNTILKGTFSTNKYDQQQGKQALLLPLDGGATKIYDHPVGKPNNYDPVYNPDPRLPDAPRSGKTPPTTTSTSTYIYIGGALVLLFVLFKK